MASLRVIIDTNIWIYLAESIEGVAAIDELRRLHETGRIDLVLPDKIKAEFKKHSPGAAGRYVQRLKEKVRSAREIAGIAGAPKDEMSVVASSFDNFIREIEPISPKNVRAIEAIFERISTMPHSTTERLSALDRLENARPPAHRYTNSSVGDALIWESVLRQLWRTDVVFCTANSKDFSDPKNDLQMHPELLKETELLPYKISYLTNVDALFRDIGAKVEAREKLRRADAEAQRLERALERVQDQIPYGKDGLDYEVLVCPECGNDTVVVGHGRTPKCEFCKSRYPNAESCSKCGTWVLDGMDDIDVCDDCFDAVMEKD